MRDLIFRTRIKPVPPAVEVQSLTTGPLSPTIWTFVSNRALLSDLHFHYPLVSFNNDITARVDTSFLNHTVPNHMERVSRKG